MALVDDPKAYILRMFQMEANEGRGSHCQSFPGGSHREDLPLEPSEMIYGIYKDKYVFTPTALILKHAGKAQKLPWAQITACSTKHGCGERQSVLTLSGGTTVVIDLHELAKGWSGRISQLLHGMIGRWGKVAALGPALLSLEEFVQRATDPYDFAPNLEPHPSLEVINQLLLKLRAAKGVHAVLLSPANAHADDFAVTGIVVVGNGRPSAIDEFAQNLSASSIVPASDGAKQKAAAAAAMTVWEVLWD